MSDISTNGSKAPSLKYSSDPKSKQDPPKVEVVSKPGKLRMSKLSKQDKPLG